MRVSLLFVLFSIQLPIIAEAANCDTYNTPSIDYTGCTNEPGCMVEAGSCIPCNSGYYCPENASNICSSTNGACECPSRFPKSTAGTTREGDCYTPCAATSDNYDSYTKDCGLTYLGYYNGNKVSCKQNGIITYNQNDANYHAEQLSDNTYGCYFKSRPCSDFITTTCSGNVFGSAIWQQSYEWKVSGCECRQEEFPDNVHFCNGKRNKMSSTSTISDVNVPINYDTQFRYWCVSCFPGYYVESNDILAAGGTNQTCIVGEGEDGGQWAVCKCTSAPQGTWISSCNITYPITNPDNPICYTTNCPPGKTTNGPQSVSAGECHYSRDTKFCDANGCFNITDADSGNWNWDH